MNNYSNVAVVTLLVVAFFTSIFITGLVRGYAIKNRLLDIPNERSSHKIPTPRGGGVAIYLTILAVLPLLAYMDLLLNSVLLIILGAGFLIATIGFLDDHGHIKARWRLLTHFVASILVLLWFGGFPPLTFFGTVILSDLVGYVLITFFLVWLINLYNFMDGIDGIAGVEAITVALGGAYLLYVSDYSDQNALASLLVFGGSVLGFLLWNLSPRQIFIGDAGSGFLGLALGVFLVYFSWKDIVFFWAWLILLAAFIVDATITLTRRLIRKKKSYLPHRNHAYQYASRLYSSHVKISFTFGLINIFWLLPIAIIVVKRVIDGSLAAMIAYIPLSIVALKYHAGAAELQERQ